MNCHLVTSRAHHGIPSGSFAGNLCVARCASMQSLTMGRFSPGAPLRFSRSRGGLVGTYRQVQWVPSHDVDVAATGQLGLRWEFAPFDGMARRSIRVCRRSITRSRTGRGVSGSKTRINATGNLEAPGLRQTRNASGHQESEAVVLDVQGMKTGSCVASVRRLLAADKRVLSVAVSLTTQTAAIRLKPSSRLGAGDNSKAEGELASHLTGSGFISKPRPTGKSDSIFRRKREEIARNREELLKNSWGQIALAWALGAFCFATHTGHLLHSVGIRGFLGSTVLSVLQNPIYKACISSFALLGPGRDLLVDGAKALWRRSPNVNSLIGVGAGAFCAISAVSLGFPLLNWDASFLDVPVMLLAFVLFGRALDGQARAEASLETHDLLSSLPSRSRLVVSEAETGEPTEDEAGLNQGLVVGVDSEQLRPGDCVLVLPDEVIPVDGKVIKGKSVVDESMLVGKRFSVHKISGNTVSAGTVNGEGPLTVEATATGVQSAVSEITKQVEEGQVRNSTVQRLADALPGSSAFSIMSLSAATFLFWYFVGAYVFPDVLYTDVAASGGSAFLPSLKLATDVLVVGCFSALALVTPQAQLLGKSVGSIGRRLTRRDDVQKRQVSVESGLPYTVGDIVVKKRDAVSPSKDTASAGAGASCEDGGAESTDAPLRIDESKGGQTLASCEDSVGWEDDARSCQMTVDSKYGQPGASCEGVIAGKVDIGSSLDDHRSERPARKDESRLLADNSKVIQLDGSGDDIVAGKDDAGSSVDSKAEQLGASRNIVEMKDKASPANYEDKSEEPRDDVRAEHRAGCEGLVEEDDARPVTLELSGEFGACEQEFLAEKDVAEAPSVESKVDEHSQGEKKSIAETDGSGRPTVEFEAHGAAEQEVVAEKGDAWSLTFESNIEEKSSTELDFPARKENAGSPTGESKTEEPNAGDLALVAGKDNEDSENAESKGEESSSSMLSLFAKEEGPGTPIAQYKAQEYSEQVLAAEQDDAESINVESKGGEQSISEQKLAANEGDEVSPTPLEAEKSSQRDIGAEDESHDGFREEKPAKKVRQRRETTVSNSGRTRLSKEEREAGTKMKKKKKDPTAPKRPLSAFMYFSQSVRKHLKESQPELSFSDTGKVLGEMWQQMSAEEKAAFEAMAEADKERYKQEMQKWCAGGNDDQAKD